jgi:predicted membrane protein
MGYIIFRIVDFLVAICMASVIAVMVWSVAHYVFGVSSLDIRRSALMGAGVFALLVATVWFQKKSK